LPEGSILSEPQEKRSSEINVENHTYRSSRGYVSGVEINEGIRVVTLSEFSNPILTLAL